MARAGEAFERLVGIMARLRAPDGCPWDRKQTLGSLREWLVEETYEVLDALERDDVVDHREELGDLLLQVVFQAQIRAEAGAFDVADVATVIADKMERRHPHVFGDLVVDGPDDVRANWWALKRVEKAERKSALDGIPPGLPGLLRAYRLGQKAARVGFDWPSTEGVFEKLVEEALEVKQALEQGAVEEVREELGDYLFTVVNLCRHLGVDPEAALQSSNHKFDRRFRALEAGVQAEGQAVSELDLDELERRWQAVKSSPRFTT